jgi:hypothetical protein
MIRHLDKPLRTAARARAKRRHKRLGWSPERRARQAELIRALKPWKKSTGPRTDAGKARCAANALKHGYRSRAYIEAKRAERQLLCDSARTIAIAKALLRTLSTTAIADADNKGVRQILDSASLSWGGRSAGAKQGGSGGGTVSSDHELSQGAGPVDLTPALV